MLIGERNGAFTRFLFIFETFSVWISEKYGGWDKLMGGNSFKET